MTIDTRQAVEIETIATPVGDLTLSVADGVLVGVAFGAGPARGSSVPASEPGRAIVRYFDGDLAALDELTVDPRGTRFQQDVWHAMRGIRPGETISYAELARRAGNPNAVRAVGTACGANPIPIVVPCHRIVRTGGRLGGYGGGLDMKRFLLDHERRFANIA